MTVLGKKTSALSADSKQRLPFQFAIVEAADVVTSHDPHTFTLNRDYPDELQPRLRGRTANRVQVERMAANLNPDALISDLQAVDRGAPIVGPDNVVESGNGRVMAILRAVKLHPDVFTEYRNALNVRAQEVGLRPAQVAEFDAPVLVRVRRFDAKGSERAAFAQAANEAAVMSTSATEKARTDAKKISTPMLDSLVVGEDQGIDEALRARKNLPFITAYLRTLPETEQAGLIDAGGTVNQEGIRRMSTAVFARAYPGDVGLRLAGKFFESTDPAIRNVFKGMTGSLPRMARAEALAQAGERPKGLSIAEDVAKTVETYAALKAAGRSVDDHLAQQAMFERELNPFQERLLRELDARRRSSKRIAELLNTYADVVIAQPPPAQGSMFGAPRITKEQAFETALTQQGGAETAQGVQGTMLEGAGYQGPAFGSTATAKPATFGAGTAQGAPAPKAEAVAPSEATGGDLRFAPNSIRPTKTDLAAALAHVKAGGQLYVATHTGTTYIDAKALEKWEAAGGEPLLKPEGAGFRMRQGRKSIFLLPGQLKAVDALGAPATMTSIQAASAERVSSMETPSVPAGEHTGPGTGDVRGRRSEDLPKVIRDAMGLADGTVATLIGAHETTPNQGRRITAAQRDFVKWLDEYRTLGKLRWSKWSDAWREFVKTPRGMAHVVKAPETAGEARLRATPEARAARERLDAETRPPATTPRRLTDAEVRDAADTARAQRVGAGPEPESGKILAFTGGGEQPGGMRRATTGFLAKVTKRPWNVTPIDDGGLIIWPTGDRLSRQREMREDDTRLLKAIFGQHRTTGYGAGVGMKIPASELEGVAARLVAFQDPKRGAALSAELGEILANADPFPPKPGAPGTLGMHPSGGTPDMPYTTEEVKAGQARHAELPRRGDAVKAIKAALRKVTGRKWSVRGGRGTSYGYIDVQSPKSRQNAQGEMREDDVQMLRQFFGGDVYGQGLMISSDDREAMVKRATAAASSTRVQAEVDDILEASTGKEHSGGIPARSAQKTSGPTTETRHDRASRTAGIRRGPAAPKPAGVREKTPEPATPVKGASFDEARRAFMRRGVRSRRIDAGINAENVAPKDAQTEADRRMQRRYARAPNRLDYEGVDTETGPRRSRSRGERTRLTGNPADPRPKRRRLRSRRRRK